METRIEYAIVGSDSPDIQSSFGTDRERAERFVANANRSKAAREMGFHFTAVQRTVTTTDWEPLTTNDQPMRGGIQE